MGLHIGYKCKCQHNLVIKPLQPSRLGRDGRPLLRHQLLGGLVETDYGPLGVIGFRV